jgi:hypothetical protein
VGGEFGEEDALCLLAVVDLLNKRQPRRILLDVNIVVVDTLLAEELPGACNRRTRACRTSWSCFLASSSCSFL